MRQPSRKLVLEQLESRTLLDGGLTDATRIVPVSPLPPQPAGVAFTEPDFGTTLIRVSDRRDRGGFETQIYSQLQAFSDDNAFLLLTSSDGYVVRRLSDQSLVEGLDTSDWNVPRWQPAQPHTLLHFDTNGDTDLSLQYTNVDTGVTRDVFTFPAAYERIRGNQSFDELSRDGRWLAGMAARSDGAQVVFSLDLEQLQLGAVLPLGALYTGPCRPDPTWGQVEPDWIGVSPLGQYLVVQWARDGTNRCSGLETFDIQTGAFVGRVNDGHQHGDLGVLEDGVTEVFMTYELYHESGNMYLGYRRLPGTATVSQPVYVRPLAWDHGGHISGQGPDGAFLITTGSDPDNGWTALEGEVFLQYTDGRVLRLAHHRSTEEGYWVQPRATISRDGRWVAFASDWGRRSGDELGRGDPYLIDLGDEDGSNNASPEASYTAVPGMGSAPLEVTFDASTSSDSDGIIVSYLWNFGDGTSAAGAVVTRTFARPGDYTVRLTVRDDAGAAASSSQVISVTPPPPVVERTVVNHGEAQRSRVTRLAVTFSERVRLAAGAFQLRGAEGELVALRVSTSVAAGRTVAVIRFRPLADCNYTLAVDGQRVQALDGRRGADATQGFFRLFGDTDGDRNVDDQDRFLFLRAFGKRAGQPGYLAYLDGDGDGDVDRRDRNQFFQRYGTFLAPPA